MQRPSTIGTVCEVYVAAALNKLVHQVHVTKLKARQIRRKRRVNIPCERLRLTCAAYSNAVLPMSLFVSIFVPEFSKKRRSMILPSIATVRRGYLAGKEEWRL